ncbi:VOC family protein [Nocardia cyriacigeorgica]|uniref:VOC family protein n=1 Tax=Nocardia cyriacigeorgica TaxID=135487 RepID=UPI002457A0CA|nr:VOC family protein [Nocardia cyriacigeorgica]
MSSITPYVMVDNANSYAEFLERALDAQVRNVIPLPADPERIIHAEARIGDGELFFADSGAHGERCLRSPSEPVHVQMWATVPDPDRTHARAVAAGARSAMAITAQDDGTRMGGFVDPFGTLWWVSTRRPGQG